MPKLGRYQGRSGPVLLTQSLAGVDPRRVKIWMPAARVETMKLRIMKIGRAAAVRLCRRIRIFAVGPMTVDPKPILAGGSHTLRTAANPGDILMRWPLSGPKRG